MQATLHARIDALVIGARTRRQYEAATDLRRRLIDRIGPAVPVQDRQRFGLAAPSAERAPESFCYEAPAPVAAPAPDSGDKGVRYSRRGDDGGVVSMAAAVLDGARLWDEPLAARDLRSLRRAVLRRLLRQGVPVSAPLLDDIGQDAWLALDALRRRYLTPTTAGVNYGRCTASCAPGCDRHDRTPRGLSGATAYGFAASRACHGVGPSHGVPVRSRLPRAYSRRTVGAPTDTATAYRYETTDENGRPVAVTEYREGGARYVGRSEPVAMAPRMADPVSVAMAGATGDLAAVLRVAAMVAGRPSQSAGMAAAVGRYLATGAVDKPADERGARTVAYSRKGRRVMDEARQAWQDALADAEARAEAMTEVTPLDAL